METKNILLINPMQNYPVEYEAYPSGALILIGTMLHNIGHNVKIVHMVVDKIVPSKLSDIIVSFKPEIVGITMSTFQTKSVKEITKIIKQNNRNILVVVGGPHPSALKLKIFEDFPYVDVVVIGEGEYTFLEIVEGKNLNEVKGLCYHNKINEPRPLTKNLDHIPLPNLDIIGDINNFVGTAPIRCHPTMFIMGSRGCPFSCTFCNKSIWGNTIRYRKPIAIIEEIKWLHEKYGIKEIFFQDDTFNLNRQWAEEIFNLIINNGLNKDIIYRTPFRANKQLIDENLLKLAKKAGFWLIFYGVENGNQEMLNRMKKGLKVEEIKRAFELTHKVGLKTIASFIIGLPGENKDTIKDSITLFKEIKPHSVGFSVAIPFPGTELEREVIEKGHLLSQNYDEYSPDNCVVRTDNLTKEDIERCSGIVNTIIQKEYIKIKLTERFTETVLESIEYPRSIPAHIRNAKKGFVSILRDIVHL